MVGVALAPRLALADTLALLPSRGSADESKRAAVSSEIDRAARARGHAPVAEPSLRAALITASKDGVIDTPDEQATLAAATASTWIVWADVVAAKASSLQVELHAWHAPTQRLEAVVRELSSELPSASRAAALDEMLYVLLRPGGVGVASLPWEPGGSPVPAAGATAPLPQGAPSPAPVAPETPVPTGQVELRTPSGTRQGWPAYSLGKRGFLSLATGFSVPLLRPAPPAGVPEAPALASWTGALRGGYAITDVGLELFGALGGNLTGPRALHVDVGARFLFTPVLGADRRGVAFHVGPAAWVGPFFRIPETPLDGSGSVYQVGGGAYFQGGVAAELSALFTPWFLLEARPVELRVVALDTGPALLLGGSLAASLRL